MNQKKVRALKKIFEGETGKPPTRKEFKAFVKMLKEKKLFNRPTYAKRTI